MVEQRLEWKGGSSGQLLRKQQHGWRVPQCKGPEAGRAWLPGTAEAGLQQRGREKKARECGEEVGRLRSCRALQTTVKTKWFL